MIRILVGIWNLLVPAKSAPAYEHQLQQNARIRGENSVSSFGFTEALVFLVVDAKLL
jgi:hypothetical protein